MSSACGRSYYADRFDQPHVTVGDRLMAGFDFALGYGGFSFTGALTYFDFKDSTIGIQDEQDLMALAQVGYLFPGTAWEIAARYSYWERDIDTQGKPKTQTIAVGVNYYMNGHSNKLQLDWTYISATADAGDGAGWLDVYPGVPLGFNSDGDSMMLRFQWQLAL